MQTGQAPFQSPPGNGVAQRGHVGGGAMIQGLCQRRAVGWPAFRGSRSCSVREHFDQMTQFILNIRGIGERFANLLPHEPPVATTQAMHGQFDGPRV